MLERNCDLFWLASASCRFLSWDFVEQPYVLDRDHRLVSEGRKQLDLLVSEGRNLRLP